MKKNFDEHQQEQLKVIQEAIKSLHESDPLLDIKFTIEHFETSTMGLERTVQTLEHRYQTDANNELTFQMDKSLSLTFLKD